MHEVKQKTLLCVYVPTTPIPTSGYVLFVPEEEVTEVGWDMEQTIQTVVSFGITAPQQVRYHAALTAGRQRQEALTPQHPPASNG